MQALNCESRHYQRRHQDYDSYEKVSSVDEASDVEADPEVWREQRY